MKQLILSISAILLLVGCNLNSEVQVATSESSSSQIISLQEKLYQNEQGFTLVVPKIMEEYVGIELDSNPHNLPDKEKYFIDVMEVKSEILCSSNLIGASQSIEIPNTGGHTTWGRVDIWEQTRKEGWWDPNIDLSAVICQDNSPLPEANYVLCSEKGKKTVVMCMYQAVNNPDQARQIFETFKWTD